MEPKCYFQGLSKRRQRGTVWETLVHHGARCMFAAHRGGEGDREGDERKRRGENHREETDEGDKGGAITNNKGEIIPMIMPRRSSDKQEEATCFVGRITKVSTLMKLSLRCNVTITVY